LKPLKIIALFLLCSFCSAQTMQPFVLGSVGMVNNLGYRNPTIEAGGGIEVQLPHLFARGELVGGRAAKIETGDGESLTFDIGVYLHDGRFLFGGGNRFSQEWTSQFSKNANRPYIGAGFDDRKVRLLAEYLTPFLDAPNALQGPRALVQFFPAKHWRIDDVIGVYRYHDTRVPSGDYSQPPGYHFGSEYDFAVEFAF